MLVPCGNCLVCLSNKRVDWSFRLSQEYKRSQGAAFITLTYHPKFLPDYGLSKRHVQLFLKRLRKNSDAKKIRYYFVGEYGSKTGRPHYHALLFNSEGLETAIRKAWRYKDQEIGIVHIGQVSEASIKYVTKYVVQRIKWTDRKRAKPFALMSRGYGLGLGYLTQAMIDWHQKYSRNYTMLYGEKGRLPRYYKEKLWSGETRKLVSNKSALEAHRVNRKMRKWLRDSGYIPDVILAEMRNALISRIVEKVAFTQSI